MAGMDATDLPDRYAGVEERIPDDWEELRGPSSGVVHLPTRLAWSGLTDFDVADSGDRFALYCLLLDCGQRGDISQHVSGELLRREWPWLTGSAGPPT